MDVRTYLGRLAARAVPGTHAPAFVPVLPSGRVPAGGEEQDPFEVSTAPPARVWPATPAVSPGPHEPSALPREAGIPKAVEGTRLVPKRGEPPSAAQPPVTPPPAAPGTPAGEPAPAVAKPREEAPVPAIRPAASPPEAPEQPGSASEVWPRQPAAGALGRPASAAVPVERASAAPTHEDEHAVTEALRRADRFMEELVGRARVGEPQAMPSPAPAAEAQPAGPLQPIQATRAPEPVAVPPPEPSLVIGRLRVEVVPPPAPPPPAPRPVTRLAPRQPRSALAPPGVRWFGLGQV